MKNISRRDFLKGTLAGAASFAFSAMYGVSFSGSAVAAEEDGLLLHLAFDEGSGTEITDLSGITGDAD
ncbi:MAG: twin-arginine translocation signal domain-containing protein [Clostridiales bacterium]|nr:twin-arginine translocation signal domain-containing protein [Clostridiales bacterium]